ncbi:hypothetical protein Pelo_12643 [Pelomyxa schiedti]|nr:hypothetical protein Pelo_12643 [Pelomyxa schiedti]
MTQHSLCYIPHKRHLQGMGPFGACIATAQLYHPYIDRCCHIALIAQQSLLDLTPNAWPHLEDFKHKTTGTNSTLPTYSTTVPKAIPITKQSQTETATFLAF